MTGKDDLTGDEPQRTVFRPSTSHPAGQPPSPAASDVPPPPPPPRAEAGRIQVGDVLNHLYKVERFIARGGMGEVFEGSSVTSDERVAIKVMLPALAADPMVQAMFRKEARALQRMVHPALVQYRVLAEEPQLGVLYIVTEFIQGANLSDVLGTLNASPDDVRALGRRLASGLRAAHALGAVHRDISPDNILLENDRLEKARIIDFGITKDIDPSKGTIVGDGFAGKLNYVAPEQLGLYSRDVGQWSDVYSLGLVLLAVSLGRDVDMGATLADAVDRRRQGPDLSMISPILRPALEQMLIADPAKRLRSMDDVLVALNKVWGAAPKAGTHYRPSRARTFFHAVSPRTLFQPGSASQGGKKKTLILGGVGAVALLAAAGGGYVAWERLKPAAGTSAAAGQAGTAVADRARQAIETALPTIRCSWLDIAKATGDGDNIAISMTGVASDPASAQGVVARALSGAGLTTSSLDFQQVSPMQYSGCAVLDALRTVRQAGGNGIAADNPTFELVRGSDGKLSASASIHVDLGPPGTESALFGIDSTGKLDKFTTSRAEFEQAAANDHDFVRESDGKYRFSLVTVQPGLTGIIRLTAQRKINAGLLQLLEAPQSSRGADWEQNVAALAQQSGVKAQIAWYRAIDEQPD